MFPSALMKPDILQLPACTWAAGCAGGEPTTELIQEPHCPAHGHCWVFLLFFPTLSITFSFLLWAVDPGFLFHWTTKNNQLEWLPAHQRYLLWRLHTPWLSVALHHAPLKDSTFATVPPFSFPKALLALVLSSLSFTAAPCVLGHSVKHIGL